jgi:hypothetical protein
VLKTHVLDGRRYAPYGFFPHLMQAIEDDATIDRFAADFGIHRDEPGLSIVVPFHRQEDLPFDGLIASVVHQYFYPITRGDLVVTVEDDGRAETINQRTIDAHTANGALARLCDLARWAASVAYEEWITIVEPEGNGSFKWSETALPEPLLESLRRRFDQGERLAFRIRVPVRRKRRAAVSHFDVVLEKDETLRRGEHHFIRRGITIPDVRTARDKPVRALLIADDDPISTFLGDAENPAHSDWSERNPHFRLSPLAFRLS